MFFILQSPLEIFLLVTGLIFFIFISWRRPDWSAALILFLAPLYLLKVKLGWLPLTVLEVLLWLFFGVYLAKRIYKQAALTPFPFLKLGKGKEVWLLSILFILIGSVLSTIFSADIKISTGIFKAWILEPMIFGFLLFSIIHTKKQLANIALALVASGTAVALVAAGYLLAGRLTFDGRLQAFYLSPNHLAMYLAPALLIAFGFLLEAKKRWQKFLLVGGCCLLVVILYFTYSYGAWLGLGAVLVFAVLMVWRYRVMEGKKLLAVCCLLSVIFSAVFFLQSGGEKLPNLLTFNRSSFESRLMVWSAAIKILKAHWLLGIGPGMFQQYYLAYQKYFPVPYLEWAAPQPHNLFLAWWLQTGLLGLLGFLGLLANFFWRARQIFKNNKQPLILASMAVMVYFLGHGLLDTTYWKNDLSLIFWAVAVFGLFSAFE